MPEIGEAPAHLLGTAAGESVRQHDRVHRTGRSTGDALDLEPSVLENMIEHAPGEGAVRAAALQRQVDLLSIRSMRHGLTALFCRKRAYLAGCGWLRDCVGLAACPG